MHWIGMSAPAWAFFTTIVVTGGAILQQVIKTRRTAERNEGKVISAANNAAAAKANTATLGNGFTGKVFGRFDRIDNRLDKLDSTVRDHLEYHLKKDVNNDH